MNLLSAWLLMLPLHASVLLLVAWAIDTGIAPLRAHGANCSGARRCSAACSRQRCRPSRHNRSSAGGTGLRARFPLCRMRVAATCCQRRRPAPQPPRRRHLPRRQGPRARYRRDARSFRRPSFADSTSLAVRAVQRRLDDPAGRRVVARRADCVGSIERQPAAVAPRTGTRRSGHARRRAR